jgi:putative membrane protein
MRVFSHPFRSAPRPLLLASAAAFPAAFFATRFPDLPGASVGSYVSTVLIAVPSLIAVFAHLGPRRAALSVLAVSAFAYAVESVGVATGYPYGTFFYGEALGPRFLGLVPYLLPVTYVPLVIGAVAAAWSPGRLAPRVALSALLLVLIDAVLDPGAAALGFWIWPEGGPYYGVPLSNFAGWLLSGAVSAALLLSVGRIRTVLPPGALDSAILSLAFWTAAAVFSGLALPALLGLILVVLSLARRAALKVASK